MDPYYMYQLEQRTRDMKREIARREALRALPRANGPHEFSFAIRWIGAPLRWIANRATARLTVERPQPHDVLRTHNEPSV